jgi:HlyD family secretion protein
VTVRPPGPDKTQAAASADASAPAAKAPPPAPAASGGGGPMKLDKVVFVLKDDGTVERRKVTLGLASDSLVEVVSGLSEGEKIVEGPYRVLARELQDGMKVETEEPPAGPGRGGPPGAKEAARR